MSSGHHSSREADRDEERLVRLLSASDAIGRIDGDRLVVFGRKSGVTMRLGSVPLDAAEALEACGALERRQMRSGATEVRLTDAGIARSKRQAAGDTDNAFARQHRTMAFVPDSAGGLHAINEAESPLLWLYRRQGRSGRALIGEAEFAAGERLRSDLTLARNLPKLTGDWSRVGTGTPGQGLSPTDAMIAARQRVERALAAVGPEMSGLLMDVCGFLKGMDLIERERGWPARSAKVVLCIALGALARHYGLSNVAVGEKSRRGKHMWGSADYRPSFQIPQPASA